VVSSLSDTLLGDSIDQATGKSSPSALTTAVGSTAANIISRSLNGIVSQTIVNQFTGGKLNYASIVTDAFGNAIGNSIAGEIRASLVANQQEGQLASAEQEVSALQRQQAMAAYGGSYASNNGGTTSNNSFFDDTADPYMSYVVKPEDNVRRNAPYGDHLSIEGSIDQAADVTAKNNRIKYLGGPDSLGNRLDDLKAQLADLRAQNDGAISTAFNNDLATRQASIDDARQVLFGSGNGVFGGSALGEYFTDAARINALYGVGYDITSPGSTAEAFTPPPVGTGDARGLSALEAFTTFNPAGRAAKGFANSAIGFIPNTLGLVKQIGLGAYDGIGQGTYAALNRLTGSSQPYQPVGAIGQAIQARGALDVIGSTIHGVVTNLPVIGTAGALYHNDYERAGGSLFDTALLGTGTAMGAVRRAGVGESGLVLNQGRYGDLVGSLDDGFQAHHVNQNAAYKSIIPKDEGFAIGIRGNAFTDAGTPHYEFHKSLDGFFDSYRKGGDSFGELPTNAQYGEAVTQALKDAGLSSAEASKLSDFARLNREAFGLKQSDPIPRVPRKIYQSGGN